MFLYKLDDIFGPNSDNLGLVLAHKKSPSAGTYAKSKYPCVMDLIVPPTSNSYVEILTPST